MPGIKLRARHAAHTHRLKNPVGYRSRPTRSDRPTGRGGKGRIDREPAENGVDLDKLPRSAKRGYNMSTNVSISLDSGPHRNGFTVGPLSWLPYV